MQSFLGVLDILGAIQECLSVDFKTSFSHKRENPRSFLSIKRFSVFLILIVFRGDEV